MESFIRVLTINISSVELWEEVEWCFTMMLSMAMDGSVERSGGLATSERCLLEFE
jgi:hypothetical protein